MILDSPWCTNDEMVSVAEFADLLTHRRAADKDDREESRTLSKHTKLLVYLEGEFSGRYYYEHLLIAICQHFMNKGDEEGCRLTGAGVCNAHYILAVEYVRNSLVLDRGRVLIALSQYIGLQEGIKLKSFEGVFRHEDSHLFSDDGFVYKFRDIRESRMLSSSRGERSGPGRSGRSTTVM